MSDGETWYDTEIAPALLALSKQCAERGMSFVATVEYAPDKRGSTLQLTSDAGLAMRMLLMCARAGENVDSYLINLCRYCTQNGIDTSQSMVMNRIFHAKRESVEALDGATIKPAG